jgi:cobalt-zinc-cadmium efflux system membrane fusion protein
MQTRLLRATVLLFWATACLSALAHEGHQPLPTKGVEVDVKTGHLTLSRSARNLLDVQTVEVKTDSMSQSMRAYARTVAPWNQHAFVSSQLPGRIVNLAVQPGDQIQAGQKLAEVECIELRNLQSEYQKAENDLSLSSQLLDLLQSASFGEALPGQRFIEAKNTHLQNQNRLSVLKAKAEALAITTTDLETTSDQDAVVLLPIYSPISGTIIHADVAVGKFVESTEHLFEIVDASQVWVVVDILEQDLHRVRKNQTLNVSFMSNPHQPYKAIIDHVSLLIDSQTQQGTAWAKVTNIAGPPDILPGMNANAEILLDDSPSKTVIPRNAVFSDGAERYVFVEETSTKVTSEYRKKPVVIGWQTSTLVEIKSSDVYPGDQVVTRGGHELSSLFYLGVLRLSPSTANSINLQLAAFKEQTIEQTLRLDGVVEIPPQLRTSASSQLNGSIRAIHIDRGQTVKKGDVLAEIASLDLQNLQLELLATKLELNLQTGTLHRLQAAKDAVSRRNLLELQNQVNTLKIQSTNLRQQLLTQGLTSDDIDRVLDTRQVMAALPVRAPADGTVVSFDRILGQVINANEPLFEIHDLSQARVQAFVRESDTSLVQIGQPARIRLVSHPGFEAEGKLSRLGSVVGADNRTQSVWIEFNEFPANELRNGILSSVVLTTDHLSPTPALPISALVRDGRRGYVFVHKADGTFERRSVQTGRSDDRFIEIKAGLALSEEVAIQGVSHLQTAYSALR